MCAINFQQRLSLTATCLTLLALLLLPLGLEMGPPARMNMSKDQHAQHAPDQSAPSPSCEHFHICCVNLVLVPIAIRQFTAVAVPLLPVHFQSIAQDIPKPPPRG